MPIVRRRSMAAMAAAVVIIVSSASGPGHAQQVDTDAIFTAMREHYARGDYAAAQIEAQKYTDAIKARFGVNHPNYAGALNNLATMYAERGKYEDAEGLYKRALIIREQTLGANHLDVASTLGNLANVYSEQGKYGDAEGLYTRALVVKELALGADHLDVALTLTNLAVVYKAQGRYTDAEGLYRRALAIREQALGGSHPDVASTLNNLAIVYRAQGRYTEAEGLYRRALAIWEQTLGSDHPNVAAALNNLANVCDIQGKHDEAEKYYRRALAMIERAFGASHPRVAAALNNLSVAYVAQGRYADAEVLCKRALAIREQALGPSHPDVAIALNSLANVYDIQGKHDEAEGLYQRALAIQEQALGPSHPDVALTLNNLAGVYMVRGRYTDAEGLYKRAIVIAEDALGPSHPDVALSLDNLANVYRDQSKYAEAEGLYRRAFAIRNQALGASHPVTAHTLNNLSNIYRVQGKSGEAEGLLRHALAITEKAFGANHPDVAQILDNLASLNGLRGDITGALAWSRKASAAVIAHAAAEAPNTRQPGQAAGLVEQRAHYFRRHVSYLAAAAQRGIEPAVALGREGFEIAQWAVQSSAAAALQQMATRFSSGSGALANVVRESQDLGTLWRDKDKALIAALSKPEGQQDRTAIERLRKETTEIESRLAANAARLEREFSDYAALANPKPLKVEEVQTLLSGDEALVFFLAGARESHVFAVTRDAFEWRTIAVGEKALSDNIANFRRGLDTVELGRSSETGTPELFDLGVAHDLYATLLAPVEGVIKDKHHLLVVPAGPLTALPFHLLVSETPAVAKPALKDIGTYRDAAWLLKRHAVTVLPSVASLKALRVFARKDESGKPLIGFGDPVFKEEGTRPGAARVASTKATAKTRAYTDYWRGAGIDRDRLAEALPRLEDTADELKAIATRLGAPASDLYLRGGASETNVKRSRLADYRVVYFATHALVAGDVKGLGEPSLALTIPKQATDLDDGLLTASEVAQLKLNADWVVLSACNTIAGDKPGAEALSGLARAFFYAGARALLVSHWAVESSAATRLTTATFEIMAKDPKAGRSEAVRRAMLDYMNDNRNPLNAYPAFWAPFSVIGEGAAR